MTLGLLVGRFGQMVRERNNHATAQPGPEHPAGGGPIDAIRTYVAHHLIPLALLARSDGSADAAEQQAILDHAADMLSKSGKPLSDADRAALKDHIEKFRPSLMQLDPALKRIEQEPPESIAALLQAAKNVVAADGKIDPAEARLLEELQRDLEKV